MQLQNETILKCEPRPLAGMSELLCYVVKNAGKGMCRLRLARLMLGDYETEEVVEFAWY